MVPTILGNEQGAAVKVTWTGLVYGAGEAS